MSSPFDTQPNLRTRTISAFKIRGATNAILSILEASPNIYPSNLTVVTHSSGNHAQALALASKQLGVRCHVVMPSNAPSVKYDAVRNTYGAAVTQCEPNLAAREATANRVIDEERNRSPAQVVEFVPPYNDHRVIAGQGTIALELIEQASEELNKTLDVLITPVGGGGMLSGCAVAAKGINPAIKVIGAEPSEADDAQRSFRSGVFQESENPTTIADGLLTSLGDITFPLIQTYVDEIFTVTEEEIMCVGTLLVHFLCSHTVASSKALRLVLERLKLVIEPSAAVPLAVVLYSTPFAEFTANLAQEKGHPLEVGIVFSGGNVELSRLLRLFEAKV